MAELSSESKPLGDGSSLRYQASKSGCVVTQIILSGKPKVEFIFSEDALQRFVKNMEAQFVAEQKTKENEAWLVSQGYNLEQLEKDSPYNQY